MALKFPLKIEHLGDIYVVDDTAPLTLMGDGTVVAQYYRRGNYSEKIWVNSDGEVEAG